MQSKLGEEYLARFGNDRVLAAFNLAADLMRGDVAMFKQASKGSAIIAAEEVFGLTPDERALMMEELDTHDKEVHGD